MSQHAGAHTGLEARARVKVAANARAVRPRIARWRGRDLATAPEPWRVSQTAAPDAVTDPGRRGCSPGRSFSRAQLRALAIENWPLLVLVAIVAAVSVHTFLGLRAVAYLVAAVVLVVGSASVLAGMRLADLAARRRR